MKRHPQHILALDKEMFPLVGGFNAMSLQELTVKASKAVIIARRDQLEEDEHFGQIIPYVVFRQNGKVFAYYRTTAAGEERLHAKVSVGFGGHVGIGDVAESNDILDIDATLRSAMYRELNEEILLCTKDNQFTFDEFYLNHIKHCETTDQTEKLMPEFIGMINDLSDPVGRVHYGLVFLYDVPASYRPSCREDELRAIGWIDPNVLIHTEHIENWTRIVLENIKFDRKSGTV